MDAGRAADPELTRAGMAAYNRWLADFCSHDMDALQPVVDRAALDLVTA